MEFPNPIDFFGQLINQTKTEKETKIAILLDGILFLGLFVLLPAAFVYDWFTKGGLKPVLGVGGSISGIVFQAVIFLLLVKTLQEKADTSSGKWYDKLIGWASNDYVLVILMTAQFFVLAGVYSKIQSLFWLFVSGFAVFLSLSLTAVLWARSGSGQVAVTIHFKDGSKIRFCKLVKLGADFVTVWKDGNKHMVNTDAIKRIEFCNEKVEAENLG